MNGETLRFFVPGFTEFGSTIFKNMESLRRNYRIKIRIYRQDNKSRSEDRRDLHNWREIGFFIS